MNQIKKLAIILWAVGAFVACGSSGGGSAATADSATGSDGAVSADSAAGDAATKTDTAASDTGAADSATTADTAKTGTDAAAADTGSSDTAAADATAADTATADAATESACVKAGGTEGTAKCCGSSGDYPNTCLVGACGCGPDGSKDTKVCNCPAGKCWDGATCKGM